MIEEKDFKNYFKGYSVPEKLIALLRFSNEVSKREWFSKGFEFSLDVDKAGLKTYSSDDKFLNSIFEFANADGSGSSYGFWLKDGCVDLNLAPIVVFGSEGGFHVVANNFDGLLKILTFDTEPMIDWDEVYYYKNVVDFKPSSKSEEYCSWLESEFSIERIDDADLIVKSAQDVYQESFKIWVSKFYQD